MYIKSLYQVTFKTYIIVVILILIDLFHLLYKTVDKLGFHKTQPRCALQSTSQLPGTPFFFFTKSLICPTNDSPLKPS